MSDFEHASLDWDEQGQPSSSTFGDVYFSRASGLEETRHVFLAHNQLSERFAALSAGEQLRIGETGFGTGLNFLCAWQLFEQQACADTRLHFVSVERYPLTHADLQRALSLWPELAPYSAQLLEQYVAIHPGFQRLLFAGGRVILTLLIDDVLSALPELDGQIDAWFLDGFSPAKNPEMWTQELFNQLARLSASNASIATFTSAGFVRRGLIEAGFAMRRVPGFGQKREMLAGVIEHQEPAANLAPWYRRPTTPSARTAIVIGAGLAGCSVAASLAARGWQVCLLERREQIASETSGNPQGVLYLKLSAHHTALSQFISSGFSLTRRLLNPLAKDDWQACGVLQLAFDQKEQARQDKLPSAFPHELLHQVSASQASAIAGVNLEYAALYYPQAGWVHPPALCRHLLESPLIELKLKHSVTQLRQVEGQWQAFDGEQLIASAASVIIATAGEANQLLPKLQLPLKKIRGQITELAATPASQALSSVVCAQGYIAPCRHQQHTLGASFRFSAEDLELSAEEHLENIEMLKQISSPLAQALTAAQQDPVSLSGRAGFRCTSPDYLPIVGPLADPEAFIDSYQALRQDARLLPQTPCPWIDGLYISSAHGSRGLLSAPLAGELLASLLNDEPLPLPKTVADACYPNRFALRRLIRGQAKSPTHD